MCTMNTVCGLSGAHHDDIQGKGTGERGKDNIKLRGRHNNIVSGNSDDGDEI